MNNYDLEMLIQVILNSMYQEKWLCKSLQLLDKWKPDIRTFSKYIGGSIV